MAGEIGLEHAPMCLPKSVSESIILRTMPMERDIGQFARLVPYSKTETILYARECLARKRHHAEKKATKALAIETSKAVLSKVGCSSVLFWGVPYISYD